MATEADILVIFGITGDLARKMTFEALYRLETRQRAQLPAGDRDRAQQVGRGGARGPRARGDRGEGREPGPGGDRPARGTARLRSGRVRRGRALHAAGRGDGRVRAGRLLPRDPAVAVRDGGQAPREGRADQGGAGGAGEAVRARPRVGAGAQRRAARGAPGGADPADRPLPRQGARDGHPVPALRQRDPRTGLEPPLRRFGSDHDARGLRGRRPRQLLRPGRRPVRRRPEPPAADARAGRDGATVGERG